MRAGLGGPVLDSGRPGFGAGLAVGACCSSGVWTPLMNRCQSRSSPSRSGPKARRKALKTRSPRGPWSIAPPSDSASGLRSRSMKARNCSGTLGAQEIDQGPGLGIEIALVTPAEAGVADQPLQSDRRLDPPPVGQPQVVGTADARPSAAADHLELRRQSLVHPVGERVVTRHQPAVGRQLVDHLVGRRAQVDRPPVEIQQRRPVGGLPLQSVDDRPALGTADALRRLVGELDPQPSPRRQADRSPRPSRRSSSRRADRTSRAARCFSLLRAS